MDEDNELEAKKAAIQAMSDHIGVIEDDKDEPAVDMDEYKKKGKKGGGGGGGGGGMGGMDMSSIMGMIGGM